MTHEFCISTEVDFANFEEGGAWLDLRPLDYRKVEIGDEIAVKMADGDYPFWRGVIISWDMGSDLTIHAKHPIFSEGLEE